MKTFILCVGSGFSHPIGVILVALVPDAEWDAAPTMVDDRVTHTSS